ncbi:MAG: hypothetical protein ACREEB_02290 [Caulobacteraceae bacterium]
MRALALLAVLLLAACAAAGGPSYDLGPGVASYDALKAATDKCHADGGQVELKSGYDQRDLSSYHCRIGGGR